MWSKNAEGWGIAYKRFTHALGQVDEINISFVRGHAVEIHYVISCQGFTGVLVTPLASDASHDLRQEGVERYVRRPGPISRQHPGQRLVQQVGGFAAGNATHPGFGESRKSQQISLPLATE